MKYDEAKLYLEHTSYDDFKLEDWQIENRLKAIKVILKEKEELEELLKDMARYALDNEAKIDELEYQQKEFVKYLEEPIKIITDGNPTNISEYTMGKLDTLKEILSKYKEIIGGENE